MNNRLVSLAASPADVDEQFGAYQAIMHGGIYRRVEPQFHCPRRTEERKGGYEPPATEITPADVRAAYEASQPAPPIHIHKDQFGNMVRTGPNEYRWKRTKEIDCGEPPLAPAAADVSAIWLGLCVVLGCALWVELFCVLRNWWE